MAKIHIIICLKITEKFLILTLTTQLHQKIRFSEFFFRILNMFAIVSNLQKKDLIFVKTHKINFLDPQTTNLNKTRRGHFWSSWPQKKPTKLTISYKMVSLLRYFVILLFLSLISLTIFKKKKTGFNPFFLYDIIHIKKNCRYDIYFSIHNLIIYL